MRTFKNLAFFMSLSLAIVGCNQQGGEKVTQEESKSEHIQLVDKEKEAVYHSYVQLKDHLVASNATDAKASAQKLAEDLRKIEGCENTAAFASNIAESADLSNQRENFSTLSSDIMAMLKNADITGQLFVQYCPMANDGEGAYWLSSEKKIKNPYYGASMLECGEVKETLGSKSL